MDEEIWIWSLLGIGGVLCVVALVDITLSLMLQHKLNIKK